MVIGFLVGLILDLIGVPVSRSRSLKLNSSSYVPQPQTRRVETVCKAVQEAGVHEIWSKGFLTMLL